MRQNPTTKREQALKKQGFSLIAGLDEAGRGAWAGPIVAGAIILPAKFKATKVKIRDSKLLTPKQRKESFEYLKKNCLSWAVGVVSQQTIDKIGILPANILAFKKAIAKLKIKPRYILVDAIHFSYKKYQIEPIIHGDRLVLSIAAASIMAKVFRDEILIRDHKKYPQYGFDKHKGYGTKKHHLAICQRGICTLHRRSFHPIKDFM